jgi:hypothetical protein
MENNEHIMNAVNIVVENVLASTDKNQALAESSKFYGTEIVKLNNEDFRTAVHLLKDTLAEKVEELSQPIKDGRELLGEPRKIIAHAINSVPEVQADKRNILIAAITDYDKMTTATTEEIAEGRRIKPQ